MSNTIPESNRKVGARGLGRYHQRAGLSQDMAVRIVVQTYPELAGFERQIRIGWNNERSGR